VSATHTAVSPRIGANLRYLDTPKHGGNVYLTAGRSFKAPTMDQLFDQRTTPVPFPPFAISTSSATLRPQHGTSVEGGAYHRVALVPGRLDARLALSLYQMEMRDELDFDLQSLRYVNLGRSRHRGAEAGVTLDGPSASHAFANYTQQSATSRFGESNGRFLKAIPRRVLTAGLSRAPAAGIAVGVTATSVRDVFLDDANSVTLPAYMRIDLRTSYPAGRTRISLNVQNLADRLYDVSGFTDPAGSASLYLYPAAGRVVTMGLESRW
jgi:outer membrane receptor protein involved in Fe transport